MNRISTLAELEAIYGEPKPAALAKETDRIVPDYARFIEAAPFAALATVGTEGLDCSPRGDLAGFVRIHDERTLMMPDRRGNNRCDSLRNIVRDPRMALMFVVPGSPTILRVNGEAYLTADADLCATFAVEGKLPRSVIVIETRAVYFQCARAVARAGLWDPERHVDPKSLPSPGQILAGLSDGQLGGDGYDADWPARARAEMW